MSKRLASETRQGKGHVQMMNDDIQVCMICILYVYVYVCK